MRASQAEQCKRANNRKTISGVKGAVRCAGAEKWGAAWNQEVRQTNGKRGGGKPGGSGSVVARAPTAC